MFCECIKITFIAIMTKKRSAYNKIDAERFSLVYNIRAFEITLEIKDPLW